MQFYAICYNSHPIDQGGSPMTTNTLTTQSLKDLLGFPFRGKEWQSRFLVGLGLFLAGFVPILPAVFLLGYFARVMRQAMRGEQLELPAWEDWGGLGKEGLRLFGITLIYLLPAQIVMFGGMASYFGGFFLLVPVMEAAERTREAAAAAPMIMFALMGVMFLSMFLGYLLMFLGAVPLPMAMGRAVEQEKFGAAFHFREIAKLIWHNKAGYFAAWVVLAGLIAITYFVFMMFYMTLILIWVAFIVCIPFGFYLMTITAALFGQTYRESLAMVDTAEAIQLVTQEAVQS
jgi:hypothetical protein